MFRTSIALVVAAACALLAPAALAREEPAVSEQIVLRIDQGNVMISQGGEFVTAESGQVLNLGDRVMVSEYSAATVFFDSAAPPTHCRVSTRSSVAVIRRRAPAIPVTA